MINKTYLEVQQWASSFLDKNDQEAEIAYHLMLDMADFSVSDWLVKRQQAISAELFENYKQAIEKVTFENYPWQYIVGKAWFYGEPFIVSPATLIPRQETEDLVTLVANQIKKGIIPEDARVVDIGTGSGIIAITLKMLFTKLDMTATDISDEALAVAQKNAEQKGVNIQFKQGDLYEPLLGERFDLIISNPPYIGQDEVAVMSKSTVLYEPHQALFAAQDGYHLYCRLFDGLSLHLNTPGWFVAEFGYKQGEHLINEVNDRFKGSKANVYKDYSGNDRILLVKNEKS